MKGFRVLPAQSQKIMASIKGMIEDYSKFASPGKARNLKKTIKAFVKKNGKPTAKQLSGFHGFVVEHTKVG